MMTALSRWRSRESLHGRDADIFDGTHPEERTVLASEQDAGDGGREIAGEQTADHRTHAEPVHFTAAPSVWSVFVFILLLIVTRFLEFAGQLFSNSRRKPSQSITASNRLNRLPFASSHGTRSSTSKNPSVCADGSVSMVRSANIIRFLFHFLLNYSELFAWFPAVPNCRSRT